ncbi:hypothetical protein [Ferdinandcohnia sp. Marseille-Q9671]
MRKIVLFPLFALLILLMPSLSSAEYGWNVRSDDFMIDEYDWNDNDTQSYDYDYDYDYEYDTTSRYGIEPLESNYRSNIRNRYIDRSYENSYIKPTQYERASYRGSLYDYSTSSYYDVKGTAESTGGGYLRNKGSYYDYDSSKL